MQSLQAMEGKAMLQNKNMVKQAEAELGRAHNKLPCLFSSVDFKPDANLETTLLIIHYLNPTSLLQDFG